MPMRMLRNLMVGVLIVVGTASGQGPSFANTDRPDGWTITAGKARAGKTLAPEGASLSLKTTAPVPVPMEMTVRVRVGERSWASATVVGADPKKPLLATMVRFVSSSRMRITAQADGGPMATAAISSRTWTRRSINRGSVDYAWRFDKVRNLWDDRDRREIGADFSRLVPFEQRVLTLRLVLTATTRQIWIDDRLVAETHTAAPAQATLELKLRGNAEVSSVTVAQPAEYGRFVPVSLAHCDLTRRAPARSESIAIDKPGGGTIPVALATASDGGVDLGATLFRHRLTHGSGPDTPYLRGQAAWPGALMIDPASPRWRVPYREYETVWLVAWVDDAAGSIPRGTFRFYREQAGYCAETPFEISAAAERAGQVVRLARKTADGKTLYLVRVPVETDAFYGFRDMADQFLDFQLSKPVHLMRSYPDPIYYGRHPGGPPSSIHVVGITLESAPFAYEVKARRTAHVFEQPEVPGYTVAVTNLTALPMDATVTLTTRSYDGTESTLTRQTVKVGGRKTVDAALTARVERLGWHELKATVEAAGVVRTNTLSLVLLPENTRSYGAAPNETRFGAWMLFGHYTPMWRGRAANTPYLELLRKLGIRRMGMHGAFVDAATAKRLDFLPRGPHTFVSVYHRLNEKDPAAMKKMVDAELAQVKPLLKEWPSTPYFYGGEWGLSKEIYYAPDPRYTGDGPRELTELEKTKTARQTKIFTAIGTAMRKHAPGARLILQWGGPLGTQAFLRTGFARNLVDAFGMDAPMFELLPEVASSVNSINMLWQLRAEAKRLGWPRLPIHWTEGPFFPTNEGALTEREQMDYQIRYYLMGLAYGIEGLDAGVVPFDAGNYYGAEHYGAGVIHRTPLENPKPVVAAIATATAMLCGADTVGPVSTGCLTTFCMSFRRAKTGEMVYALWRVRGTVEATVKVDAGGPVTLTDAMGNRAVLKVDGGNVKFVVSPTPVWLTGMATIQGFSFGAPVYRSAPAAESRRIAEMTADAWAYDGRADASYGDNHFAVRRITDPKLGVTFGAGEKDHPRAAAVTLPVEPTDRPLAIRYGALKARAPIALPGRPSALGLWVKGNSAWGRIAYRLRDAKGERWTSIGTKDDWNCDDTKCWSFVGFEGWRYVRFPLPGNLPWDAFRTLESTWWKSEGGDGIVDLPLSVEAVFVEARNQVPYLGTMTLVPERTFKLSGLTVEYASAGDMGEAAVAASRVRKPVPQWEGPSENPIARLEKDGVGRAPAIAGFSEPGHWNDGRRMVVHFKGEAGMTYHLYVSLYADGRGAERIDRTGVKDGDVVFGFKPETPMYVFLTAVGKDRKESKPSKGFRLVTHDNFAEK